MSHSRGSLWSLPGPRGPSHRARLAGAPAGLPIPHRHRAGATGSRVRRTVTSSPLAGPRPPFGMAAGRAEGSAGSPGPGRSLCPPAEPASPRRAAGSSLGLNGACSPRRPGVLAAPCSRGFTWTTWNPAPALPGHPRSQPSSQTPAAACCSQNATALLPSNNTAEGTQILNSFKISFPRHQGPWKQPHHSCPVPRCFQPW